MLEQVESIVTAALIGLPATAAAAAVSEAKVVKCIMEKLDVRYKAKVSVRSCLTTGDGDEKI